MVDCLYLLHSTLIQEVVTLQTQLIRQIYPARIGFYVISPLKFPSTASLGLKGRDKLGLSKIFAIV